MEGIYEINTGKYTGILQNKNQIYAYGIIERGKEKKEVTESDHKFIIVDLVKFYEHNINVNSNPTITLLSTTISVNSMTANNIAFSNGNITVNKEVLSDATA